jgi:hypothetical protein
MFNNARADTRALARVRAMHEHEKYVGLATYGESKYVPSEFGHMRASA